MKKTIIQSLRGNINRTVLGLVGVVVVSSIIGIGARVYAGGTMNPPMEPVSPVTVTDVVDTVNLTIPVSCTFGSGGGTYNDTMAGGTVKEITANAITTSCNDTSGYAIYAIGFSNNKYTSDTTGNNNDMITSLGSSHNITTSSNNTYGSNWKMKLTSPTDATIATGYDSYTAIPATYTKIASYATNTTGGSITPKYQITTGSSQPAGTYTGKVKYTLVHPSTAPAPVACNPDATAIGDVVCLQDFAGPNRDTIVASMTAETQYTKKDKRDGKTYTIAKLADGNVWMTQNLDLDLDASKTYTNLDTDLGWNTSTNTYQTASWIPARSTYATSTNNIHAWCQGGTWNTQYGYCEQNNTPESYDPGNLYWNTTTSDYSDWDAYYNSCNYSTSTPSCNESLNPLSTYASSTGTAQYHLGNFYNWSAAIASNDASIYGTYNETTGEYENLETHQSICPAGWTLPYAFYNNNTDQSEGDFVDLWTEYGWDSTNYNSSNIANLTGAPLYFVPAGDFGCNLRYVGYGGGFWSSVAYDDYIAGYAYFGVDGYANPAYNDGRSSGYSVRCLLR